MRSVLPMLLLLSVGCPSDDDTDVVDDRPSSPQPFDLALGKTDDCAGYEKTRPETEQVGGWSVAKLDTPWTPAQIEQVVIRADGRRPCTITVDGKLRVARGGATPPENPEFIYFADLDGADEGPAVVYTIPMPASFIDEGESLYVYHQLTAADGGGSRCSAICQDEDRRESGWITAQAEPPYTYTPIDTFGALSVEIVGQSPVTFPE